MIERRHFYDDVVWAGEGGAGGGVLIKGGDSDMWMYITRNKIISVQIHKTREKVRDVANG